MFIEALATERRWTLTAYYNDIETPTTLKQVMKELKRQKDIADIRFWADIYLDGHRVVPGEPLLSAKDEARMRTEGIGPTQFVEVEN